MSNTELVSAQDANAAIQQGLAGLATAISNVVGPAPTDKSKHPAWSATVHRAAESFVGATIHSVRHAIRQDRLLADMKVKFLSDEKEHNDYTVVTGEVLGVFTYNGVGVMILQSRFTAAENRLPAKQALQLAKEATARKDSEAFRSSYNNQQPGPLGAVGIERYWLGLRSEEQAEMAYQACKACEGSLARVYKYIETSEFVGKDGKNVSVKRRTALWAEKVLAWESTDSVDDMITDAEVHANSGGAAGFEQFDEFDDVPADASDEVKKPIYPTTPDAFKPWATERGFDRSAFIVARASANLEAKALSEMTEDDIADVCDALIAA